LAVIGNVPEAGMCPYLSGSPGEIIGTRLQPRGRLIVLQEAERITLAVKPKRRAA
jgi:hypothetical protein